MHNMPLYIVSINKTQLNKRRNTMRTLDDDVFDTLVDEMLAEDADDNSEMLAYQEDDQLAVDIEIASGNMFGLHV